MNLWEWAKKAAKYVLDLIYRGWKDKKAEEQLDMQKERNKEIHIEFIEEKEK